MSDKELESVMRYPGKDGFGNLFLLQVGAQEPLPVLDEHGHRPIAGQRLICEGGYRSYYSRDRYDQYGYD